MDRRNPIRQNLVPLRWDQECSIPDHAAELLLARETRNRLDQDLIQRPIASHQLSNVRDSVGTPLLVDGIEQRVLDVAELQARKHTAGLQHPVRLLERNVLMREVPDTKRDRVQINAVIRDDV